jgi:hypothetical protein
MKRGKYITYQGLRVIVDHIVAAVGDQAFVGSSCMLKAEAHLRDLFLDNIKLFVTE